MVIEPQAMAPLQSRAMQRRNTQTNSSRLYLSIGRRQKLKIIYFLPICFLLFGGGLSSCGHSAGLGIGGFNIGAAGNVTKISDIQQNQNATSTVYLQGQVATRAPFLGSGAYKLQDATGGIWVLTAQTLPNVGDEVLIKGQLQFQSIGVSGQELGEVYVQEQQVLQRRVGQPGQTVSPKGNAKS
ncbi:MAG TPA: hypothetical protein V6D14_12910 [Coleofasciculaceae cyanobacterium]|jgi:hypothetical protein